MILLRRAFISILSAILVAGASAASAASGIPPEDTSGKEFIAACTYGVLAGTLVGAASLAFTSSPGKNLNRVARGASIGLYTGILLGAYVVYVVPSLEQPEEDPLVGFLKAHPFWISPTFGNNAAIDGAVADVTIAHF
jgi:hypothetical protein